MWFWKLYVYNAFKVIYMHYVEIVGLILNFVGAIFVAFSVIENPGGGNQMVNGKKIYLASILPNRFRLGIGIFALGFLFQLAAVLLS